MQAVISIIIPIYNAEQYLRRCLDSVLSQTFTHWVAICVNDGSSDNSGAILDEYGKKDPRFKIIHKKNAGVCVARNVAIELLDTPWTCFLDADDAFAPYTLDTFYKIAQLSKLNMIICDSHTSQMNELPPAPILKYTIYDNVLKNIVHLNNVRSTIWNKLIKTDLLKSQTFIPNISTGDWPFLTVLCHQLTQFALVHTPLYMYNQENISITRSPCSVKKINSYMIGMRYVYEFYKDKPDLPYAKQRINIAIKMCVNKVYRDKKNKKTLVPALISGLKQLHKDKVFAWHTLPFKTLYRLWRLL